MRLTIQTKLLAILLAIGVPTLLAMSLLGYVNGQRTIRNMVNENLVALNATKARHLESYFTDLRRNVGLIASDRTVAAALPRFATASKGLPDAEDPAALWAYFEKNYPPLTGARVTEPADDESARRLQELYVERNPFGLSEHEKFLGDDGSEYTKVHREYHPYLVNLRDTDAVNNLMLVDAASRRIVYAVTKNADFQASLDGPLLQNTNLRETIDRALRGEANLVDFQRFAPAFNDPVAYVSVPIRSEGFATGAIIGCVVAQIKIAEIDRILSGDRNWAQEGLGATGDTYVIGADQLLRSDTRNLIEKPDKFLEDLQKLGTSPEEIAYVKARRTTVLAVKVSTSAAIAASQGKKGFEETTSLLGNQVFAAYAPLSIDGLKWGILSRRNTDETLSPINDFRRNALLTAGVVLILIAATAVPLAKSFVAPITAMSAAARRFGKGERGLRLSEAHRDDEFGELALQFNTMVEETERLEKIQQGIRRNIVHDLKTPVTVIKGMGETLMFPEMAEDPTWRDEMVRAIVEQSDRLLDDLKDILQPIDADYRPETEEFDLSLVVERVVKSEKHTSRAADHLLVVRGTDGPMLISGDRRKLRRVCENLLSNAIKYSPGTGKRVDIEVSRRGENEVAISFRDQGLGMEPEQLQSVLADGGRVSSHAQMGIEGTGFGLDSVQTVLRAHGGRLEAVSEPNKGSTFTAVLPLRVPSELAPQSR